MLNCPYYIISTDSESILTLQYQRLFRDSAGLSKMYSVVDYIANNFDERAGSIIPQTIPHISHTTIH